MIELICRRCRLTFIALVGDPAEYHPDQHDELCVECDPWASFDSFAP